MVHDVWNLPTHTACYTKTKATSARGPAGLGIPCGPGAAAQGKELHAKENQGSTVIRGQLFIPNIPSLKLHYKTCQRLKKTIVAANSPLSHDGGKGAVSVFPRSAPVAARAGPGGATGSPDRVTDYRARAPQAPATG